MDTFDRAQQLGMAAILFFPVVVILIVLWYLAINVSVTWVKTKERPAYAGLLIVTLPLFMVVTRAFWLGYLWKIIAVDLIFWIMTHGRGRLATLTPSLRLKFCSTSSIAWCGAFAGVFTTLVIYLLLGSRSPIWSQPVRLTGILGSAGLLGAIAALCRRKVRLRWPEAIEMSYVSRYGSMGGGGFFVDEVLLPVVLLPLIYAVCLAADNTWGMVMSLGLMSIVALIPINMTLYALWAWFHSGILGLAGNVGKSRHMEYQAFESLIWDDHVQKWLGDLQILADPHHNRYVLTGMLPERSILATIRKRLSDIDGAEVDDAAVMIDATMEPNYHRLSAILRRGTYASRRQAAGG